MSSIVRLDGEGQYREEDDGHEEEQQHAERGQAKPVKRCALEPSVEDPATSGADLVIPLGSHRQVGSRTRPSGSVVHDASRGVQQREDEQQDQVIPRGPVSILVLVVVRHLSLREVVRGVKGKAGIVVASWIRQGEVGDGRGSTAMMHVHVDGFEQ